ncbi:hypothetical protein OB2597_01222 [Pseudooceanicola batsensis HTCC2597]|uniref:Excinuclease ABC subunit A n=1 Tax=Pseudooceanicola batsensis (strain ATCC BAA-863 / DSM 15984 / KCTC 12145 / HTCC2597) TaxID=252305 RepID=A3U2T7_PSEBH|nr:hypothetical protein [Pseudooceanicola batsensis]EAQ01467.1 hypothetical protein OB2597_01222 [Pseudooceanicola batsensis HTCC2597]
MTRFLPILVALAAVPGAALAEGAGAPPFARDPVPVIEAKGCPPGLAKKSPACVPPGQAKTHRLDIGDRLQDDGFGTRYVLVRDPGRYGLDPYGTYYEIAGQVYQVDRETHDVLALIGAAARVLN